ncbi:MAG: radical SAM protein [Spirochaetaceae bacterium]|nr:radical SAM protein [Spirochaetaceae bacterium]
MDITLIKPKIGHPKGGEYLDEGRMEPLMLGVLGGLTPPEHHLTLWDDRFEPIDFDRPTDLVAITVETFTARRSYEIALEYRNRGVPVVMGGIHASLLTQEVAQHCDTVITGDAEQVWSILLEDFQSGEMKAIYKGIPGPAQGITQPRRDLFAGKGYLPVSLIQFSRGCPNHCFYCATSAFFEHTHHVRPVDRVIQEIGDKKLLFFVDDNFTSNKAAAKELLRAMIPLKTHWVGQMSLDVALDDELLTLLQKSGCMGFVVGFESINSDNVTWMKKNNVNSGVSRAYEEQISRLKDFGFQIWAAFTLGHDFDTQSSIEDTVAFALKHRFSFAAFNILLPYPGTPLYDKLNEENRLLFNGNWWLHTDYRFNHAAFIPKHMTPDQLTQAGMAGRKKFNSFPSVVHRALDLKTNLRSLPKLWIYMKYSLLFRREVARKENMILGGNSFEES